MGLDMYLYAERRFDPNSDAAKTILDAAGVTLDDLTAMAAQDPYEHETSIYLPRWEHSNALEVARAVAVTDAAGLLGFATDESPGGDMRVEGGAVVVSINAIYWRKANAIHAWFVDNCQDGIDECQVSPVDGEQLAHLRSTSADALAAYTEGNRVKAAEILTPRSGFFFGSTDVDEWWAEDLAHTIREIDRVVQTAIDVGGNVTFAYHSSW